MVNQNGYTIISDPLDSDAPYTLPPVLAEEYAGIMDEMHAGIPVVHRLKQFIQKYPEYPQALNMLGAIYMGSGKITTAMEIQSKLLANFPDYLFGLLTKLKMLLAAGDFDEIDASIDLSKSFGDQFPQRKRVMVSELVRYETTSIEYLLANAETGKAIDRCWQLIGLQLQYSGNTPFASDLLRLINDYVPREEFTPKLKGLFAALERQEKSLPPLPVFHHPEILILYQLLEENDIPAILALRKLPRETLLLDLRMAIRDGVTYYRTYTRQQEDMPDLLLVGFLLLADMQEPGELSEWIIFLQRDAEIIEGWMGDWFTQMMYVVGYEMGRKEPEKLKQALLFDYRYDWSAVSIATSLMLVAAHDPAMKQFVTESFLDAVMTIMYDEEWNVIPGPNLLETLLGYGCELNPDQFIDLLENANLDGQIDEQVYKEVKMQFFSGETLYEFKDGIEFTYSRENLKQRLFHLFKGIAGEEILLPE